MDITLEEKHKYFEKLNSQELIPHLPVCVRLDGVKFSKFTSDLRKDSPYNINFSDLMVYTTIELAKFTNANIAYTGSDEITLILYASGENSELLYGGNIQKLCSILASKATCYFNKELSHFLPEKVGEMACFDCRAWSVPSLELAADVLLWREESVTRNSISMAAQFYYSHKELHKKNSSEMHELLFNKGVNWNDYPDCFKRGSYIRRNKYERKFTEEEISRLPDKHEAKRNPNATFSRHVYETVDMPIFSKIKNKVGVIFNNEIPVI